MDQAQQEAIAASIRELTDVVAKAADQIAQLAEFFTVTGDADPARLRIVDPPAESEARRAQR